MCGIAGAVCREALPEGLERRLAHRGPDARGRIEVRAGDLVVTLAHTRLAIIDLSDAGAQPMTSRDGRWMVTFNGEIYNYRQIRGELERAGVPFRGFSDTEVLVEALARFGHADALARFRGMFAYAAWDRERRELTLVRDRIGVKPLFWARVPGGIAFASEMKALVALPSVSREIDPVAVDEYLSYLYFPSPRTVFRDIRKLAPAHQLVFSKGDVRVERYWAPRKVVVPRARRDLEAELRARIEDAVQCRLVADVPLGAFLSGGLDSSTIVSVMARASSRPVRTFCMTFGDSGDGAARYDEREYARIVARHFGTNHVEIPVRPNLLERLTDVVRGFDEPFGNPTALLAHALSAETRRHVTVALSGDGGDEAFAGYPRHTAMMWASLLGRLPGIVRRAANRIADAAVRESVSGFHLPRRIRKFTRGLTASGPERYFEFMRYFGGDDKAALFSEAWRRALPVDHDAARFVAERFAAAPVATEIDAIGYVDVETFLAHNLLEYTDRMSMAHALEVRNPFCDHVLLEFVLSIPFAARAPLGRPKALFRAAVSPWLPRAIARRPKLGFNPPLGIWLADPKARLVDDLLGAAVIRRRGVFRPDAVRAIIDLHRARRRDLSLHLWALVMLEAWWRDYGP